MATGQYRKPEPIQPEPDPIKYQYKTFSPNQWGLVRLIRKKGIITHAEAVFVDQRPFNSFCRRDFIIRIKEGYTLSDSCIRALKEYEHTDVVKERASDELGKYVQMMTTITMRGAA